VNFFGTLCTLCILWRKEFFLTTDYTECTELCDFGELLYVNFFGTLCTLCILWTKEFF